MATTTLRALNGFDETPASLADSTLILVDFQNTYTTGVMELEGWQQALESAAALLGRARAAGAEVIHVVNDGGEGTPYDIRAEIGEIHPLVAPVGDEPIVVKQVPNAFVDTDLGSLVDAAGNKDVIVVGFMTHMCVLFTTQGAFLHGNRPTVVADACATRPLSSAGVELTAHQIHHGALATVADLYGVVVPSQESLV
ncbi:cysteine hydrolase family protein [Streptomyces clavuligerus]|uniref:Putative isochorismatase n=1 Tax=Streptomyces clavuligerus TaxID=1901 RepID=B5GM78_STRCL|nr:cysteine hydrolase family protein [Streptomyces clavuligerus]ANW22314.1 isochorismatase [Streptomyces clavuligerus]AXU17210.1 cysteine hydrolase [Streptomyces clavuligerus]EDY47424.1 isochorismatase hydrolase [Streptomyces clavuligerus]EFG04388.1 Putative isochorismatase [Streptomyces clavuligerus]MBY6307145.1 cysteine hydrolase [Streptomyces clavuligerus]